MRLGETGFSLVETLVATLLLLVVTGAVLGLMAPASGASAVQPHLADLQQRMRVAVAALEDDLAHAGAAPNGGPSSGGLSDYTAPILPYRAGPANPDPPATFRSDVLTVASLAGGPAYSRVARVRSDAGAVLVELSAGCGSGRSTPRCGFDPGMRVMLYEPGGASDIRGVADAFDHALLLVGAGPLGAVYEGAFVTELRTRTYYLRRDQPLRTAQLMRYDGVQTDLPVVDDVVGLEFAYWGDPAPPVLMAGLAPDVRRTTYGPSPPALGASSGHAWPDGENCAFTVADGAHVPRLATWPAEASGLVELTAPVLTDGPWCPDAVAPDRFDADLLRIRRIEVRVRVQAPVPWLRGRAPALFAHPGTASPVVQIPDAALAFTVSPRNLNLVRGW